MPRFRFRRVVIKLGTSTLTGGSGRLSYPQLLELVRQMAVLWQDGVELVVVTSGAVAAGRERWSGSEELHGVLGKQALAAVGQPRLMAVYEDLFAYYGIHVAQVLLTRRDFQERASYLNAVETLRGLLRHRFVPVVNENDTVATEEIRVGDNDNLSALVASQIEADLLVLLTDQAGLMTGDPRTDPNAALVAEVSDGSIPDLLWAAAGGSGTGSGTGGMRTKLQAAEIARRAGVEVLIAHGSDAEVVLRSAAGEAIGTRFTALESPIEARRRYLLAGWDGRSRIAIDAGAGQALTRGGSLLAVGVTRVDGTFERGDIVAIVSSSGRTIAHGVVNYDGDALRKIQARRSEDIERILGYEQGDEVVHRDRLVLLAPGDTNG